MRKKDVEGYRLCSACNDNILSSVENFYQKRNGSLSSECRSCFRKRSSQNQKTRHHAGGVAYHLKYITRGCRQRARRDSIAYDFDDSFLACLLDVQGGLCAISKVPLTFVKGSGHIPTNASVERIDSAKGYTKDNIQLVAFQVNTMKSNLSLDQLNHWCKLILEGRD